MERMRLAAFCVVLVSFAGSAVPADRRVAPSVPLAQEFPLFRSIEAGASSDDAWVSGLRPVVFVADTGVHRMGRPENFVGTLKLSSFYFARPAEAAVYSNGSVLGVGLPRDMARIRLNIGGESYDMHFIGEQQDPEYGLRHVTMRLMGSERSYARFSVDDRAGLIYGTVRTPYHTFRIVPSQQAMEQDVYRLAAGAPDLQLARDEKPGSSRADVIAWRYQLLEKVALIQPRDANVSHTRRSSYLSGGNLGNLKRNTAEEVVRLASSLASVTQFTGAETLRIVEVMPTMGGGSRIRFQQMLEGVPVEASNEVNVDASGKVLHLSTILAPREFRSVEPSLLREDAWRLANAALADGEQVSDPLLRDDHLVYRPNGSINDLRLHYVFRIARGESGFEYLVYVDATTGATEVAPLFANNFSFRTCNDTTWGSPPNACPAPGSTTVLPIKLYAVPAATGYPCPPESGNILCANSGSKNVYEILSEARSIMPAVAASNPSGIVGCCTEMGTVQAVTNSRNPGGSAATAAGIMHLAGNDYSAAETVLHEWAHIYQFKTNDRLSVIDSGGFAKAMVEGTADTIAGLYGSISGYSSRFGSKWTYGDGPNFSGVARSASDPNFQYWQDIKPQVDSHLAGQVIYRFFRRLQETTQVSDQRLLGIVMGAISGVTAAAGTSINAGDFKQAVLRTLHPTETQLRTAVEAIYAELYKPGTTGPSGPPSPPGTPGPTGSPLAPLTYSGSFSGCGYYEGVRVSIYTTWWPASAGATSYGLFAKGADEPAYRYTDTTPGTTSYIYTNIPGDGRVNACNGSGCSGLSVDRVVVSHQAQCLN